MQCDADFEDFGLIHKHQKSIIAVEHIADGMNFQVRECSTGLSVKWSAY